MNITLKGNPLSIKGQAVEVGQKSPDFLAHSRPRWLQKPCVALRKWSSPLASNRPRCEIR